MQWLRLYHDTINDPKWRVVSIRSKQPVGNVLAVWVQMLVCASAATERGTLEGWDDETSAAILGYDPDAVSAIREAMQGRVLDGLRLTGWDKRQFASDTSAERTRRYRAKNAQNDGGDGGDGGGTAQKPNGAYACHSDGDVTSHNEPVTSQKAEVTSPPLRAQITETQIEEITDDDAGARHVEIGQQVAARAGMPPDPDGKRDYSPVIAWLDAGADPILDVFPAVARTMARVGGRAPFSLAYFTQEITAGLKARTSPLPEPDPAKVAHLPRKQSVVSPASQDRRGVPDVLDQLKAAKAAEVKHG